MKYGLFAEMKVRQRVFFSAKLIFFIEMNFELTNQPGCDILYLQIYQKI